MRIFAAAAPRRKILFPTIMSRRDGWRWFCRSLREVERLRAQRAGPTGIFAGSELRHAATPMLRSIK